MFQCSSASRKFLNIAVALQYRAYIVVSVLFSEPKIPQFQMFEMTPPAQRVSVLFSEPKIPQWGKSHLLARMLVGFSALQRAENSSIVTAALMFHIRRGFSALQRAENSSMVRSPRRA